MDKQKRPVYLNMPKLASNMSITEKVSILHRVSGVLLFIALPFLLSLLHKSLVDEKFYSACFSVFSDRWMKIVYIVLIWAIMHHLCAGIRFIFIDNHQGIERLSAQKSARWVIIISLLLTIVLGVSIW
jgi:succinate dehydrogenase / fumarate reductase cytochrome b subunit